MFLEQFAELIGRHGMRYVLDEDSQIPFGAALKGLQVDAMLRKVRLGLLDYVCLGMRLPDCSV